MLMSLHLLHQFCAISNTQVTNIKSYIVKTLSVGVATYYCMYTVLVADYCARWLGTTYNVELTVIPNRQATCKFNAQTVHYYQNVQCTHIIIM